MWMDAPASLPSSAGTARHSWAPAIINRPRRATNVGEAVWAAAGQPGENRLGQVGHGIGQAPRANRVAAIASEPTTCTIVRS